MRTEGPPVSSELQLGYEEDHQNCSFDISVCGNLTEDYQAVRLLGKVEMGFFLHLREVFFKDLFMLYFVVHFEPNGSLLFGKGSKFSFSN